MLGTSMQQVLFVLFAHLSSSQGSAAPSRPLVCSLPCEAARRFWQARSRFLNSRAPYDDDPCRTFTPLYSPIHRRRLPLGGD